MEATTNGRINLFHGYAQIVDVLSFTKPEGVRYAFIGWFLLLCIYACLCYYAGIEICCSAKLRLKKFFTGISLEQN